MPKERPPNELLQRIMKDAFDTASVVSEHPIDNEDLLLRWSDRQLSQQELDALLNHLARCSQCRKSVAEMIKNGILEFKESPQSSESPEPASTVSQFSPYRFKKIFLGIVMTSALCLLLCLFWIAEHGSDMVKIAHNSLNHMNTQMDFGEEKDAEVSTNVDITTDIDEKLSGATRSIQKPAKGQDQFALLIGINKYGKLDKSEWLDGCHNDVDEVESVITGRFGFDSKNVTKLLDEKATAKNIRKSMSDLVKQVQARSENAKPAQVLFYFSGHGSQIPDQPEGHPDCDSDDGFDSTLVVYDSEKLVYDSEKLVYDSQQQGSETDIRDDELNKFAHDICSGGKAELLICLDSCHSGGGARGITKFRGLSRTLKPTKITDLSKRKPKTLPQGTVFLSACQSNQKEPEYEVGKKQFGLFTYHLTQLLKNEQIVSSLDYVALKDIIHRSYQRNKIAQAPTPTIEGNPLSLKKPILGANRSLDRKPYWEAKRNGRSRDSLRLEAGKINDVTENSLFELYETPEQTLDPNAKSLGWFRISKVEGRYSLGDFFQWKDANRSEEVDSVLPNNFSGGYAIKRYHDYGENFLSVRLVDSATEKTISPNNQSVPTAIRSVLLGTDSSSATKDATKEETHWIRWVGESEPCDLVVKYDQAAKLAAIFPATGISDDNQPGPKTRGAQTIPKALQGGWGPIDWDKEQGAIDMSNQFRQVMKVLSLQRLVAEKKESAPRTEVSKKEILNVALFRYDVQSEEKEEQPIKSDPGKGIVLVGGEDDWYQMSVKNNDVKPLYLTVLCIGPDMRIDAFAFGPQENPYQFNPEIGVSNNPEANKLAPGEEFVSIFGFEAPFGAHSLIVLATREQSDFSFFAQAGLVSVAKTRGSSSPILEFIAEQCAVGPKTRGSKQRPIPRDDAWFVNSTDVISTAEE